MPPAVTAISSGAAGLQAAAASSKDRSLLLPPGEGSHGGSGSPLRERAVLSFALLVSGKENRFAGDSEYVLGIIDTQSRRPMALS